MTNKKTTQPDTHLPPSHTVILYDNGIPIGSAPTDANGAWSFLLTNLTEGSHIMEAESSGNRSESFSLIKIADSEAWSNLTVQRLKPRNFYFGRSGLAVMPVNQYIGIESINGGTVLALLHPYPEAYIMLPVAAKKITFTLEESVYPYSDSVMTFHGLDNTSIPVEFPRNKGDTTYDFQSPVRGLYFRANETGGRTIHISKLSWET